MFNPVSYKNSNCVFLGYVRELSNSLAIAISSNGEKGEKVRSQGVYSGNHSRRKLLWNPSVVIRGERN